MNNGKSISQKRFWVAVATKEHMEDGVNPGIAQFCHGKWVRQRESAGATGLFTTHLNKFQQKEPCQEFTAIETIVNKEPYQVEMIPGFKSFRRNVKCRKCKSVQIKLDTIS